MVEFHLIPQAGPGRLWIMPCPDAGDLDGTVATLGAAGVQRIVSMLAPPEAEALGLTGEAAACRVAGIAFHQHGITDFGLPDRGDYAALCADIQGWIAAGEGIAVHCRAGIGRSGMVTAGVLILQGLTADQAVARVSDARGVAIPDTVEQRRFIADFAQI